MEGHGEAAADVITGGVIARAVEPAAGESHKEGHGTCLNCGATVSGAYCSNCGQATHLHRSLSSLGHDILHGVFHFEGKTWRTVPELFLRPGNLTRRYINGERAKFVSPMALYLFSVFLMFAVMSLTGITATSMPDDLDLGVAEQWKENIESNIEKLNEKIEAQREQLAETDNLSEVERKQIEASIAGDVSAREAMQAMISGDLKQIAEFKRKQDERAKAEAAAKGAAESSPQPTPESVKNAESSFELAVKHAADNPTLLAYKLKSAGYKYSWALIPLSVPFMWLLFFWRRDVHLYDHAIFVTYSISFMMLFVIVLSVAHVLGVSAWIWGPALAIVPPLHLYKQLRGAYGLSRFGAWVRLFLLTIMITFVLVMFGLLLLALGMSG
ncbi:DUF3667 domain-containing protein [Steroidobacter sp.]|uniref:DUF3667 domain-containing protein n=1 Tax=Steroidobacter sp. TaxID=1978227 RepID=UPI001A5C4BB5|nr:DUF3667 domain-containing protein [Steroidobacter sp.]MBL8267551.1 DUF3667 domain-containing protein [Steroidobacter sp.]